VVFWVKNAIGGKQSGKQTCYAIVCENAFFIVFCLFFCFFRYIDFKESHQIKKTFTRKPTSFWFFSHQ